MSNPLNVMDHNQLWRILKEMEYQITFLTFWEICMQVKNQQLELGVEQQTGSKLGKEYFETVCCHTAFLTYADYIMWNARLNEAHTGIKITRRNINKLRYANDNHPCGRKWRRTKEPLDKSEIGEWKICLKFSIQKNEDYGIWSHYFMVNR